MELQSHIKSYLDIPVVLGIALCQSKVINYENFIDQVHNDIHKNKIFGAIRSKLLESDIDTDFYECSIFNYQLYIQTIDEDHKLITLLLHENNVIKSFRAPQLVKKIQNNIHEGKKIFKKLSKEKYLLDLKNRATCGEFKEINTIKITEASHSDELRVEQVVFALNELSRFTKTFLGPQIISNYWQMSRPDYPWLQKFTIKYSAAIKYQGNALEVISPVQMLTIREWTQKFMEKCHIIIHDLPQKFEERDTDAFTRKILAIYTSENIEKQKKSSFTNTESLFD